MTRTYHRGTGALIATLLAFLLILPVTGTAHAAPDHRDDHALGRYADTNSWGDFSTPLTQSLAILALHRASDTDPSQAAVELLLAQQCADGSFPDAFRVPTTDEPAPCAGGVDTTAFAILSLHAIGQSDAVDAALTWLADVQDGEGGFGGQDGINSNSTGLAALALALGGYDAAAEQARAWIRGVQDGCDADTPGAIPFNADERGAVELSTSQAVLGLVQPAVGLDALDATAADGTPTTGCETGELSEPAQAAAAFLVGEVADDPFVPFPGSEFPNVGGTIDVLFALAAVGTSEDAIAAIVEWLPAQAPGYTQDGEGGAGAGATAKLILALLAADEDPRQVAGLDLVTQLTSLEVVALPEVTVACGEDTVAPGDELSCTISGLLAFEGVDVRVEHNPVLLDEQVSADPAGEATFSFAVPDDLDEGGQVTITVDGLGAEGLAGLTLAVSAPASEEVEEADVDEEADAVEEDQDVLPETGDQAWLLAVVGGGALLLGMALLLTTRRDGTTSRP